MKNFALESIPVANRRMHLYMGQAKVCDIFRTFKNTVEIDELAKCSKVGILSLILLFP